VVDEDALHCDDRGAEEAAPVGETGAARPDVRLVNPRRGVERRPAASWASRAAANRRSLS
jgi:hypothetical protein